MSNLEATRYNQIIRAMESDKDNTTSAVAASPTLATPPFTHTSRTSTKGRYTHPHLGTRDHSDATDLEGRQTQEIQLCRDCLTQKVDEDEEEELESPPKYYVDQLVKFFEQVSPFVEAYNLKDVLQLFPEGEKEDLLAALDDWSSNRVEETLMENGALNTSISRVVVKFMLQL